MNEEEEDHETCAQSVRASEKASNETSSIAAEKHNSANKQPCVSAILAGLETLPSLERSVSTSSAVLHDAPLEAASGAPSSCKLNSDTCQIDRPRLTSEEGLSLPKSLYCQHSVSFFHSLFFAF
jgi:hypothetical protein